MGRTGRAWVRDDKVVGAIIASAVKSRQDERKYADLSPQQMLEADPNNFAFAFDDLKRIELKKEFGPGGRSYLVIHPIKGSRKALYFGR